MIGRSPSTPSSAAASSSARPAASANPFTRARLSAGIKGPARRAAATSSRLRLLDASSCQRFSARISMNLDAIPIGKNPPFEVNVVVEVPLGGEPIKYEMHKASGALYVDRFLYTPMRYPGNYGFIPHTLSGDGDPCDVLVANTRAVTPCARSVPVSVNARGTD